MLYKVNQDLSPDLSSFEGCLSGDSAAAMLIHYFGFPSPSEDFAALCRRSGIPVIEDACHVDFAKSRMNNEIGKVGDWIFASPRKFYKLYDGGVFAYRGSTTRPMEQKTRIPRLSDEARAIRFQVERGLERLGKFLRSDRAANSQQDSDEGLIGAEGPPSCESYKDPRFNVTGHDAMTYTSRVFLAISNSRRNARRRRLNYEYLASFLKDSRRCDLLFQKLPENVYPYVCPVILKNPETDHRKLRSRGIKVLRWEDFLSSPCSTSERFREQLVQFPLDWRANTEEQRHMMETLADILM